uniref:peptidylprolyl isomerase n=1 Tax=Rhizophora mucronata TaxID=61149 RepID=A0A2P2LTV9_RHIMU
MELCLNSTRVLSWTHHHQQQGHRFLCKTSISLSFRTPFLQSNENSWKKPSNPQKIPSFSRQVQRSAFLRRRPREASAPPPPPPPVDVGLEKDGLPADISVTETPEPNSRVRLHIEAPPAVCDDCYKRVMNEFMKQAKVPGFRPGKAVPESILISHVGKQNVQKATVESILKRTLPHALSKVTERALRDSVHIVTKFSDMEKTNFSFNSLRYDVIVDVAPEVKWIPENGYKNLKIVVEIDTEIDAQRASERELRQRHKSLGLLQIVTDRGLQIGDVAVLDISATNIEKDESSAQNIPVAESKGFHFDTEDGDKVLPGFLDSIVGIQRGETKSFPLVIPDSWKQENLRGFHAQFTVSFLLLQRSVPHTSKSSL